MKHFQRTALNVVITAGLATPVLAQPVLEEVIVTAEFASRSVQDTPLSITALSGDMLEARGQTRVTDVAVQAPNVTLKPGGGTFGPALQAFIRGIGQDDFNLAYEPGVGMYVDDVYYSTLSGSLIDLVDIDRIEILRGPQGTLSGKNSIGGSIKVYSKRPVGDESGYITAIYGDYDRVEFRGAYDTSLVDDTLFLRVSGTSKTEDGYVDRVDYGCENPGQGVPSTVSAGNSCTVGTEGGREFTGLRAALRWLPSQDLDITLTVDSINDKSEAIPNQLAGVDASRAGGSGWSAAPGVPLDERFVTRGKYKTYSNYLNADSIFGAYALEPVAHMDSWGVAANVEWRLSDSLALHSITAYRDYESRFTLYSSGSPLMVSMSDNIVASEQISQELRLSGAAFTDRLEYTVGVFWLEADNYNGGRQDMQYIGPGFGFIIDDDVNTSTAAVFAHAQWRLSDRANLTLGLRYTEEEKTYHYARLSQSGDGTTAIPQGIGVNGKVKKHDADNVDYRINFDYRLTDDTLVYAQYATGFKGGGPSPRPFNAGQSELSFDPETVDAFELGLKSEFFNNRLRLNTAAFFNKYEDKQIVLFACPDTPCASPGNAGDADIWGVELELLARPVDQLEVHSSLSYINFEYKSLNPLVIPTGVTLNTETVFTPEWQFSIGASYTWSLPGGSALKAQIDGGWQDDMYTDASNKPGSLVEDYWLWNGRLSWLTADEDLELAVEVTNFTDEFYYQSLLDISAFNGVIQGTPAPPRRWAVSIKKMF